MIVYRQLLIWREKKKKKGVKIGIWNKNVTSFRTSLSTVILT